MRSVTIGGVFRGPKRPLVGAGLHYGFVRKRAGKRRQGAEFGKGLSLSLLLALLGCGQQYRPVVSAINPVGPAGQPTKYAIAISNPSASNPGLLTAVDFSGDSILATPQILPNPTYLSLYASGATALAINAQNSAEHRPGGPALHAADQRGHTDGVADQSARERTEHRRL